MQLDRNFEPPIPPKIGCGAAIAVSPVASLPANGQLMKKKTRILAVDDEPVIGESLAYNLEAPHRKIAVAPNGREALSMASKRKFDVVITDHRMPEAGGLELVRALRKRKFKGKIVVLSGHLSPENIGVYEELEIDEVISKPCLMEELRDVVADLEEDLSLGL
jgi:YesN/AraC family two-component response regulator